MDFKVEETMREGIPEGGTGGCCYCLYYEDSGKDCGVCALALDHDMRMLPDVALVNPLVAAGLAAQNIVRWNETCEKWEEYDG